MPVRAEDLGILSRDEIKKNFEKWFAKQGATPNIALQEEATLESLGITDEVITKLEELGRISRRRFDPKQRYGTLVKGHLNLIGEDWTYGHFLDFLYEEHLDTI
ncbi:hypothetical protein IPH19_03940 [Candidatus Uhrbacteria bacterium]|nr:MAG: hypothetical protein IPH19_03940 [Candidatus Uhrbacteria bacterium]